MIQPGCTMRISLPVFQQHKLAAALTVECPSYKESIEKAVRGGLFIDSPEVHTWYHFFSCPMTLDAIFEMATVRNALQLP